jgi:hypothetical protein
MRITLCGSTRFKTLFQRVEAELSKLGHVVYSCALWGHTGDELSAEDKLMLDAVHMAKIANSDCIFVINQEGYVGESTLREIFFAHSMRKRVNFLILDARARLLKDPLTVRGHASTPHYYKF